MDTGRDSASLLVKLIDEFGARVPIVVVLNEVHGSDFGILESSGALARAKAAAAEVISIRRLQEATMQKIDAQNTSFWAASHRSDGGQSTLGLLERQRVKYWLQKAYAELDRIAP